MNLKEWKEQLLTHGYRHYPEGDFRYELADEFWSRWIRSGNTKLFAVNAYLYYEKVMNNGNVSPFGIMFEATFYVGDELSFSVTLNDAGSVNQAHSFFSEIYDRMHCCPDLYNNDNNDGEIPFISFNNATLEKLHPAQVGDVIECVHCGGDHPLKAPDDWDGISDPLVLYYKCDGTSYLGAVAGKRIVNVKPDSSGSL